MAFLSISKPVSLKFIRMRSASVRVLLNITLFKMPAQFAMVVLLLLSLGCAKKQLRDEVVPSSPSTEFQRFRADLSSRYTPSELQLLDTAIQELKLDAMERGVQGTAAREQDAFRRMGGKSVHEALVLGYTARRSRLLRELTDMEERLEHASKLEQTAVSPDSKQYVSNLLKNERDLIAQIKSNLAATDEQLQEWGAAQESK